MAEAGRTPGHPPPGRCVPARERGAGQAMGTRRLFPVGDAACCLPVICKESRRERWRGGHGTVL